MEENEVLEAEVEEVSDDLGDVFDKAWDEDDTDDGPIDDDTSDEVEEGQPDDDHDETEAEEEDKSEEPGAETEEANQLFKIKYNGNEEELTLDQMTELAQKGRNYDHVREERDNLRGKSGRYESFLQKLADKAGVSIDEQIDLTEAMWLMDEEAEKGNSLTEAEALLRVQRNRNEVQSEQETQAESKADLEISRFMKAYPDVRAENIPKEVWDEVNQNEGDLLGAYQSWENRQLKAEIEKLKKEAHNERNAQRSTGPRKSSGANKVKDAFDEGWDSEF